MWGTTILSVLVTWLDVPFQLCRGPQDLDPPYWICQVTRWQPTSVFVLSYCKHGGRPHLLWNRPAVIFLPLLLHPGPRAASAFGPGQTGTRAGAVQVWGTASHGTGELELEEVLWIRFFKMSIFSCFGLSARPASSPRNMADSRVSWPGWVGMRPSKDTSRSSSEFPTPAHPPGITGKKKNRTWKKFWKWVGRWQILLNVEGLRQKPQFFETLEENFHPEKCTWRRKFGKSFFYVVGTIKLSGWEEFVPRTAKYILYLKPFKRLQKIFVFVFQELLCWYCDLWACGFSD